LPAAVTFISSDHHNSNKDSLLVEHMAIMLPLRDYMDTWAPAVEAGYLRGYVSDLYLGQALFPLTIRADMFVAYKSEPVHRFYNSLLQNNQIAGLRALAFPKWKTIGETANAVLDGEALNMLQEGAKAGELPYEIGAADVITSCATLPVARKSN
jgi:hypothetical protein